MSGAEETTSSIYTSRKEDREYFGGQAALDKASNTGTWLRRLEHTYNHPRAFGEEDLRGEHSAADGDFRTKVSQRFPGTKDFFMKMGQYMTILNIPEKGNQINIVFLGVLALLLVRCNPGKSMQGKEVLGKNTLRYDTLYYTFKKIQVRDQFVYMIIDSLIAEMQTKIMQTDTVPFFGTIVIKPDGDKTDFHFTLSNRHSSVYNNEVFLKNVSGGFSYKDIFFFVVIDKGATQAGLYYFSSEETITAKILKLLRANIEVNYSWLWIRRIYSFEKNNLVFKSKYFDRTEGDFHTQ